MSTARFCACVLLLIFTLPWAALAQARRADAQRYRVQVKVSADDDLKKLMEKSLQEQLRALPEIEITDTAPHFVISIIALKVATRSRNEVGAAFSVLVTESSDEKVRQFAASHLSPELASQLESSLRGAATLVAHWVETAATKDVSEVVRGIVHSLVNEALNKKKSARP